MHIVELEELTLINIQLKYNTVNTLVIEIERVKKMMNCLSSSLVIES